MMRGKMFLLVVTAVVALTGIDGAVHLEHASTIYLPFSYSPVPDFQYDKDVAEQSAYSPESQLLYTVGNEIIHVIDLSDISQPRILYYTSLLGGELTDVEVCGDYVAVAFDNRIHPLEGKVIIYKGYNKVLSTMEKVHEITVGALPDMLKFTGNCEKIVVALEGELRMIDGKVVDPEGGVGIIHFRWGHPGGPFDLHLANFTKFNYRTEEYLAKGVRWVFRGQNAGLETTLSQDLEPEYVTFNGDYTKAYITLEENNAIAVVDVEDNEIVELYPLGSKPWGHLELDPSDRDRGIRLGSWPVWGLYQPDALKYVTLGGNGYILTANEGEDKTYENPDFPFEWSDAATGKQLVEDDLLHESVPLPVRAALADDTKLGRLFVSTVDGLADDGRVQDIHTYGGRSWSLWRADDLSLAWDSGDDVEKRVAEHFPHIFSSSGKAIGKAPEDAKDSRAHKKGPETETLDIGDVDGKTVIFVANERPGVILLYSIHGDNTSTIAFESAHYAGGSGRPWEELFAQRKTRDVDPEDIRFLSSEESPTGRPLLVVSGTTSATVSFYHVINDEAQKHVPEFDANLIPLSLDITLNSAE